MPAASPLRSPTAKIAAAAAAAVLAVMSLLLLGSSNAIRYGVDAGWSPVFDVEVPVGSLTAEFVDGHPEGTRFGIVAGVHRVDERIRPRAGQQFLGLPGAVVSGSKVLTQFHRDGAFWVADGQTQRLETHGNCSGDAQDCRYAEDVFVDDEPLAQVMALEDLVSGGFYFDYDNDRIYLADDPAGRHVETNVTGAAFWGVRRNGELAPDVVIRNLVVEKFGSPAQRGAIDSRDATGWKVINNTVRLNHGVGVYADAASLVSGNQIVRNGQMGIAGGKGTGAIVENNEIAYNNWAGFSYGWEAGGTKWTRSDGLIVRGNWSHHNHGPGLWTDEGNINTTYVDNLVEDNYSAGIFHEISYDAVLRNNTIRRNGHGDPKWGYGAGIQISASPNVTVTGNTLEDNARGITLIMQHRGTGPHGPREIANVTVTNNTLDADNGFTGLVQDIGDKSYFTTKNNTFTANTYHLPPGTSEPFQWDDGPRSADEWAAVHPDDGPYQTDE